MNRDEYTRSIFQPGEHGRLYWIYHDVPEELWGQEFTEEEMKKYTFEQCYLDDPDSWSQEAVDRADMWLSIPNRDVLEDTDRYKLEKALSKRKIL